MIAAPCHHRKRFWPKVDKICIRPKGHDGECFYVVAWEDHIDVLLAAFLAGCLIGWAVR